MDTFIAIICLIILPVTAQYENQIEIYDHVNVKMPTKCQHENYCPSEGLNYPHYAMEKLKPKILQLAKDILDDDIGQRVLEGATSECNSKSTNISVYYIKDMTDQIRVVVQIKGVFEQIVGETRCINPGVIQSDTKHLTKQIAMTYKMYCKEILRQDEFYVLTGNFESVEKVSINSGIPVYCACRYDRSIHWSNMFSQ